MITHEQREGLILPEDVETFNWIMDKYFDAFPLRLLENETVDVEHLAKWLEHNTDVSLLNANTEEDEANPLWKFRDKWMWYIEVKDRMAFMDDVYELVYGEGTALTAEDEEYCPCGMPVSLCGGPEQEDE